MSTTALFSVRTNEVIPQEERMRRIGVFVCRIVQLEPLPAPPELPPPPIIAENARPDERVLGYLSGRRNASPVEIRLSLGLSRSMTYRSLLRLTRSGLVVGSGSTKAMLYRAIKFDLSRN